MSIETFAGNIEPSRINLPISFHIFMKEIGVRIVGGRNVAKIEMPYFAATELDISNCGNEVEVLRALQEPIANLETWGGPIPVRALMDRKAILTGINQLLDADAREQEYMRTHGVEWSMVDKNRISYSISSKFNKIIDTKSGHIVKISSCLPEDHSPIVDLKSSILSQDSLTLGE